MPHATDDRSGSDRYGDDVLAGDWRARGRRTIPEVPATRDLVVELAAVTVLAIRLLEHAGLSAIFFGALEGRPIS